MPAIDHCEPQVIAALEKAGWKVIDQPFPIRVARAEGVFADLRLQSRDVSNEIIVLEVKCFNSGATLLDEFYRAVGQYLVYRNAVTLIGLNLPVFLSVPHNIYSQFFTKRMISAVVDDAKIKLIIIDLEREEVVRWIP